jgi:AraC-like DNA-binding protein
VPNVTRLVNLSQGAPFYANSLFVHEHWGAMRRSDYFEIMAITGGEGWHTVSSDGEEGTREPLVPGQMFFFRPQDVHEFGAGPDGMSLVYVDFSLTSWQLFTSLAGVSEAWFSAGQMPRITFDPADEGVIGMFQAAVDSIRNGATEFDLIRFWVEVIPLFLAAVPGDRTVRTPSWLTQGLESMREEDNLRRGVARLRELAHVSAAHLSRSIRQHFGVTPTEIVADMQLRHAAILLSTTPENVGIIGARCGFSSPAYFSTRFRAVYAMSPTEYRQRSFGELVRPPQYATLDVSLTSGRNA